MWCQPSDVVADRLNLTGDAQWRLRCRRCGWHSRPAPDRETSGWMLWEHIAGRVPRHRHVDRALLQLGADLLDVAATSEVSGVESDALSDAAWKLRQAAAATTGSDSAAAVPVDVLELLGAVRQLVAASPALRADLELDSDFRSDVAAWTGSMRRVLGVDGRGLLEDAA